MVKTLTPAEVAGAVLDPELPLVTIAELGILRGVEVGADGSVAVTITPTYSGCPAMDVIRADIRGALHRAGHDDVRVETVLAPAWTTDWITDAGKAKLSAAGIAPPGRVLLQIAVRCPRCGSGATEQLARFGSTACKSLWRCRDCREPFDHIKPL